MKNWWQVALSVLVAVSVGCGGGAAPSSDGALTSDRDEDFDHDHEHTHGDGHDHEHSHRGGHTGSHSHSHSHSHRHTGSVHGGKVVSIGHTHHAKGETHYHAEVMPVVDGRIVFHVLTEDADGKARDLAVETDEVVAFVNDLDGEPENTKSVTFTPVGDTGAEFGCDVPAGFENAERLLVVVPRLKLGRRRMSFDFTARRAESKATEEPESETGSEASS